MDEISQIHEFSMQKVEFLEKLREHCNVLERASSGNATSSQHREDKLLNERIDEAIEWMKEGNKNLPQLVNDLKNSLDVVIISSPYMQ